MTKHLGRLNWQQDHFDHSVLNTALQNSNTKGRSRCRRCRSDHDAGTLGSRRAPELLVGRLAHIERLFVGKRRVNSLLDPARTHCSG